MLIELHVLQNFAPSNLNRDDTGAPKTCQFGGVIRGRVSSQSWKRPIRAHFRKYGLRDADLGKRSLLFKSKLAERLIKEDGKSEHEAQYVADYVWSSLDLIDKDAEESGYLLFLGNAQVDEVKKLCVEKWDAFQASLEIAPQRTAAKQAEERARKDVQRLERAIKKKSTPESEAELTKAKASHEEAKEQLERVTEKLTRTESQLGSIVSRLREILATRRAADIALFGRMITSAPKYNIDAASQVAHALSTHAISGSEFDYFTALDELKDPREPGAALISTMEFNSMCCYRYANVNLEQLKENLKDRDGEFIEKTVRAFMESFIRSMPTGKQNSFPTPTRPQFVLAVAHEHEPCSLANAFEKPVRPSEQGGIVEQSVKRLDEHFGWLNENYGEFNGDSTISAFSEYANRFKYLAAFDVSKLDLEGTDNFDKVIKRTIKAAFGKNGKGEEAP